MIRLRALSAVLVVMSWTVASSAQAQTPPPVVQAAVDDMATMCREVGGSVSAGTLADFPQVLDLTGDGVDDWVLVGGPECQGAASLWSGSGGTQASIYVGDGRGGATESWSGGLFDMVFARESDRWRAYASVGGVNCGQAVSSDMARATYDSCLVPLTWDPGERRFYLAPASQSISDADWQARVRESIQGRWAEPGATCDGGQVLELSSDGRAQFAGADGRWTYQDGALTLAMTGENGPVSFESYSAPRVGGDDWTIDWWRDGTQVGRTPFRRCGSQAGSTPAIASSGDDEGDIRALLSAVFDGPPRPPSALFAPEIVAAAEADRARGGLDPFCQCPDPERVSGWRLDSLTVEGGAARALVASQVRGGRWQPAAIQLIRSGEGWRVADIMAPGRPPWRAGLPRVAAAQAPATSGDDEQQIMRLIDDVYAGFASDEPGAARSHFYTARMIAEGDADEMFGLGNMLCGCQDFDTAVFSHRVSRLDIDGDRARATVLVAPFGDSWSPIEFDMVRTPGGWRIDDLN